MSYLSTSGNVGFSGLPQNISEASCATQYKMAVEGVQGVCSGEVTNYANDASVDEAYVPTDYYHTKFKIDPNEIYTFHDSDVIENEITVSHTEDNTVYNECVDYKKPDNKHDFDVLGRLSNGEIKDGLKEVITNGHYDTVSTSNETCTHETVSSDTKVAKTQVKEYLRTNVVKEIVVKKVPLNSSKVSNGGSKAVATSDAKSSINNANTNHVKTATTGNANASETFLDVFKREQMGMMDTSGIKVEPTKTTTVPVKPIQTPRKTIASTANKSSSSSSKSRRGRGPALHEALQRIPPQRRVVVVPNRPWHAPGHELFNCGPLTESKTSFHHVETSSEDDDHMPTLGMWMGCAEESSVEGRGSRLALRRAALRRQVAQAAVSIRRDTTSHDQAAAMLVAVKKQIGRKRTPGRLSPYVVNHLLVMGGMNNVISSRERRKLRETGWSGGESCIVTDQITTYTCIKDSCENPSVPCGRYCLSHVTLAPEQRLYAACSAVFAGGSRCKQPLLPLHDQTPLCTEHAWKRDNYDKISRECKPKKVIRKRVCPPNPRRAKRRRRPPAKAKTTADTNTHTVSELNVCSNSSAYDSSEDTRVGALSENEYVVTSTNAHNLEVGEVGQVPPDDILDPAVLSQIPDEAFTEFFNQSEGGPAFAESEELARALEAVLDERALDSIADCVFTPTQQHDNRNKIQVPAPVTVEMSSGAPS